jgi:RNA polymerase sigma-70 factor (ECF subfamily)
VKGASEHVPKNKSLKQHLARETEPLLSRDELVLIYQKNTGPLYGFVSRRVGGDRALAEDIVQEAWMRAVATWPHRGVPDQPAAWLRRVARNLLASHYRRRRPHPVDPAELDLRDDGFNPETPWAAALVNWGLARMRRRPAELIEAFHIEGKSLREIAAETGLTERAVEGRLTRARAKLRRKLEPHIKTEQRRGNEDAEQART